MQLLQPDRVHLSCMVLSDAIVSLSAAALRSHPLHLLLPDCVHVQPQSFWKVPALAIDLASPYRTHLSGTG